jgi:hypothetical protein
MKLAQWFEPPRVVLTLFIGLMSVCAFALGWLGWQVVVQDRVVEAQRRQEQLDVAADRAAAAVERALSATDAEVTVTASGEVSITPGGRLAYSPTEPVPTLIPADTFSAA